MKSEEHLKNFDKSNDINENNKQPDEQPCAPKKRGRPRKNQEKVKITEPKKIKIGAPVKKNVEEDIILHLPLYDDDSSSEKNMFTMKDETDTQKGHKKISAILSISDESANEKCSPESTDQEMDIHQLISELKKKDVIIKKLRDAVTELKNTNHDQKIPINSTKEHKTYYHNANLIDIKDGKSIVVEHTNVACWWDTHTFDTVPVFIPDRYNNDKYYVFGCFCSFNCALAYNLNMVDDYRSQIRHSLIKKMYYNIFGSNDPIPVSPQKELLIKFGGILTIEEFRDKALLLKKGYKITLPPIIPLLPIIEEYAKDTAIIVPSKVQQYTKKSNRFTKENE